MLPSFDAPLVLHCRRECALKLSLPSSFLCLCSVFSSIFCHVLCTCVAFHYPLLSMSSNLVRLFCSSSVFIVTAMKNCFADRICRCFFSCPFMVIFNISDPCRTPLLISVHGRLFDTLLIFCILIKFSSARFLFIIMWLPMVSIGFWQRMLLWRHDFGEPGRLYQSYVPY